MTEKMSSGQIGEEIAVLFLRLKGYRILERNLRTRISELDVVARLEDCCVFVEVKLRGPGSFLQPAECIDARKKARVARGAAMYFRNCPTNTYRAARFDVIAISFTSERLVLDHIEDAFAIEGCRGSK